MQPGAKNAAVAGLHGGALKLRVTAPATGDRANLAVCALLAARLEIPLRTVSLRHGHKSRHKVIAIDRPGAGIISKIKQLGVDV